ncbi:PAAR motif protein [compost metagenome]
MAIGHFIRVGDKTTCGGTVQEGDSGFLVDGQPRAREGDRVTCGVNGETYSIVGGVSFFTSDGRFAAGTLDSVSSCPCEAGLIASVFFFPTNPITTRRRQWAEPPLRQQTE